MNSIWFFEKVDFFDFLCPNKLDMHAHNHVVKKYKKGDYIYFSEAPSKSIYLIASGKVKILNYTIEGNEVVKAILTKGELFGEMAILGEEKRQDFAVAFDDDTLLCQMNIEQMQGLMIEDRDFALNINKLIGWRIRKLERRLDALIFKDVKTRILDFLKEFAEERGVKNGKQVYIKSYLTHKDIADLVGTSRQTVTSYLNELKSQDKISFNRKNIVVHDIDSLVTK